jgi:phosphate transport system substrate-binding protein
MVPGLITIPGYAQVTPEVEQGLKPYSTGTKLEGAIATGSSETFERLLDLWIKEFQSHHHAVTIKNEVIKASEAKKAFAKGVTPIPEGAHLVALSYPLTDQQVKEIKAHVGHEPVQIPVALDGIVIYVNHRNPLEGLTLSQVGTIFGTNQSGAVTTWSQLGVNGPLGSQHMNLYVRNSDSGTYAAFKEMALKDRDQVTTPHVMPGSRSIALEVGSDEFGIGYAAMGFATRKVKVVPLAREEGQPFVPANNQTISNGTYPLVRSLYFYLLPESNGSLNPIAKEFAAYVLSLDGQRIVMEDGFVPLSARVVEQARLKLEGAATAKLSRAAHEK